MPRSPASSPPRPGAPDRLARARGAKEASAATPAQVAASFEALEAEAVRLAGPPGALEQRAEALGRLFEDSGGQHGFALLAGHSAKWMDGFLGAGGVALGLSRGVLFSPRLPGRSTVDALDRFSGTLKEASRQAFVDVHTAYHFARAYPGSPEARAHFVRTGKDAAVSGELFDLLSTLHTRQAQGGRLDEAEQDALYRLSLSREQDLVDPLVQAAFRELPGLLQPLARRPVVRLDCFPRLSLVRFHDFSRRSEREANALTAWALAKKRAGGVEGLLPLAQPLRGGRHAGADAFVSHGR